MVLPCCKAAVEIPFAEVISHDPSGSWISCINSGGETKLKKVMALKGTEFSCLALWRSLLLVHAWKKQTLYLAVLLFSPFSYLDFF